MTTRNALLDPAPSEVPLACAPLVDVLCAVHFPAILKIVDSSGAGVAPFQEAIRRKYPTLTQETEQSFTFQVDEKGSLAPQAVANQIWRLVDSDGNWRVTLGRDSLALETQAGYTSRVEFLDRFEELAEAFVTSFEPSQCTRIGVRYVNVLAGEKLVQLARFVNAEFRAFGSQPYMEHVVVSTQHAEFRVPEGRLITRAGILQPGQTHDPRILMPSEDTRYFLDIDAISMATRNFASADIRAAMSELSQRAYAMFRGAVTDEFLEACNA